MKTTAVLIALLFLFTIPVLAQTTGNVDFPQLGISFTIPAGWVGYEVEDAYLIGSETEPGLIMLSLHQHQTVEQLRQEAAGGIHDGMRTSLRVSGDFEPFKSHGIGTFMEGTIDGTQVKVYAMGLVNSHGYGVTILAAAEPSLFSNRHKDLVLQLAESFNFSKVEAGPVTEQWRELFQNAKLTYLSSYSSTGGGTSARTEIHLCSDNRFMYSSNSTVSVDTGGVIGFAGGPDSGNGNWSVEGNRGINPVLILSFTDGRQIEFEITSPDNNLHLNNRRYFRTYDSNCR